MSRSDIEAGERRWVEAFNAGDAAALARCHTTDTRLLRPNMPNLEGRDAIEATYAEFLKPRPQMAFELLTVHEAPELCAAVGLFEMEMPDGDAEPRTYNGKFVEVWTRQPDGSWLIADHIFN